MMENLKRAVDEYLQNDDSQLLLVAISQYITAGHLEEVSSLFLLPEHRDVVKAIGWDLLSLVTPHLTAHTTSPTWQLISIISEVCSAKEMCLAFLEQLELMSSAHPSLFFQLLRPLHTVFVRMCVGDGTRHASSLRSLRGMLERVYPSLNEQLEEEEEEAVISPLSAAESILNLLTPFTSYIHNHFTNNIMPPLQTFWTPLQRECVGLLLTLLGEPLVSCDLQQKNMDSHTKITIEAIMYGIVQCHCGCLQLIESTDTTRRRRRRTSQQEDDAPFGVPMVGVACFIYLIMVEGVHSSYLPSILHPHYLLHIIIIHTLTLIHRSERQAILKGLCLLESAVKCVAVHSLPRHSLSHGRCFQIPQCLVDIMVTCPHKNLRQRSVVLLPDLINRFHERDRHRLYRRLLSSCNHAGVQGLLIHCIKNEVNQEFNRGSGVSSPFLGSSLIPILDDVFMFSSDTELLKDMDRVMAGLNFLRYLLIRDKPAANVTGIWDKVSEVRSKFTIPLRHSLEVNKQQFRGERERQRYEDREDVSPREQSEVSVEVIGEDVPDISVNEQMKMMLLAEHQLDMMECVLVRVEELSS